MPASKLGFIALYRSKKKEAVEKERQNRFDLEKRAPQIIDPSFELFGHKSPQEQYEHDTYNFGSSTLPGSSTSNDDWIFHNRRASTLPHSYQFEPHCEVTPKSSVSSSNSNQSDSTTHVENDMTSSSITRPRPQSYLPPMPPAHPYSTTDLDRSTAYKSRRHNSIDQRSTTPDHIPTYEQLQANPTSPQSDQVSQPYKLEASLSRPFSLDQPYEDLDEPEEPEQAQKDHSAQRLAPIPEDGGLLEHRDDLVKRGYVI